jgi:cysteine desulfurase
MKTIYLDNAATTPVDKKVVEAMEPFFSEQYGNASSAHIKGQEAKRALEQARDVIAHSIGAKSDEIFFTSGGTESNNLALKGLFFENKDKGKNHIITTKIDHDCILNSCKWLEKQGADVTYLDVDKDGFVNLDELKKSIKENTLVVSIIHGNNEIGTIQPIEEIGKICREKGVYFHTDACQSYTKIELDVKKQNLDLVTLNAHKIHGPKGVGALYIRKGIKIIPLLHGGGHEKGIRGGTENVAGIVGFAKAVKLASSGYIKQMEKLRNKLMEGILKIENTKLNGPKEKRLCNNVNICFNNIEGEAIGGYLEAYGICSSTGSACSSHTLEASHVLKAIGRTDLEANSSIRLSLSRENTAQEIDKVLEALPGIVTKLRKMSPFKI